MSETVDLGKLIETLFRWARAQGAEQLADHPGIWERAVDETWRVAINGHRVPETASDGVEVPPFHVYITFAGWPWALFHPMTDFTYTGHGEAANPTTLLAALQAATR